MKTDSEIQKDVMNELKWRPMLTASNIGVAVKDGIVTLSGQVNTYAEKLAAEAAAKKVYGVRALAEDIQIGVSPAFKKSDTEIAAAVLNALKLHSAVPDDMLKIKVDDGYVTLEGVVDWEYQRDSAKAAISNLSGVRGVVNLMTLKPRLTAADIKSKITAALQRTACMDAAKINVVVVNNRVELYGKLRTIAEKDDAIEAAWCAPGVTAVRSHLEVEPQLDFAF